jgi:hypothetical protein
VLSIEKREEKKEESKEKKPEIINYIFLRQ